MNNQSKRSPNHSPGRNLSDLEWTAFCFLTDELDSLERTRFEELLENNTAACEALADMVELLRQGSRAVECGQIESGFHTHSARNDSNADDRDPETVCEPNESYSISPAPPKMLGGRAPRARARRFWTSTCAIALLVSIMAYFLSSRAEDSVEPIAEAWAGQLDDSNDWTWLADDDATELPNEAEAGVEGEEDWLFTALVSLEEWPANEQGDGT